jgi:hypothetical protein
MTSGSVDPTLLRFFLILGPLLTLLFDILSLLPDRHVENEIRQVELSDRPSSDAEVARLTSFVVGYNSYKLLIPSVIVPFASTVAALWGRFTTASVLYLFGYLVVAGLMISFSRAQSFLALERDLIGRNFRITFCALLPAYLIVNGVVSIIATLVFTVHSSQ